MEMDNGFEIVPIKGSVPKGLDILHVDNLPFHWWEYARTFKAPHIIAHVHGNLAYSNPELTEYGAWQRVRMRAWARVSRRRITHFLPVSHYLRHFLTAWGVDPDRTTTIYNGVDPMFFERPKGVPPVKGRYILHVSKYQPKKNTEALVRAFPSIRDEHPDLKLVIAGPGHKTGPSGKAAQGMKGVKVLGKVSIDRLTRLYWHAEIFVFPSLHETFGIPIVEAMAAGVPVVTTRRTSLPEVGGDAAWYVEPTPGAIAEGVIEVMNGKDTRSYMRHQGQRIARKFTWERAARDVLRVYEGVGKR